MTTEKYYDRDLSWLRFNHRVLQEANDTRNPLYERIKFLAIFSSNLDEFFEVRVSDIRQIKGLDKALRKKLITKPNRLLREIKIQVTILLEEFDNIFYNKIIPELYEEGINIISYPKFDNPQQEFIEKYYKDNLESKLEFRTIKNKEEDHLFIKNEKLYLISLNKNKKLVYVAFPEDTPRFVEIPNNIKDKYDITFLDDILQHCLKLKYGTDFYSIKVSRDAELYIENEFSGNLLEKIKDSLTNRDTGQVTRALVQKSMPDKLLDQFMEDIDITETDIISGGKHQNLNDLFSFPNPTGKKLSIDALPPKRPVDLKAFDSIFDAIKEKDRLLYFPYESFYDVIRLVEEAAADEYVTKIKITLYRISENSEIANALLNALKNGKKIYVFIETKARFDEANNIRWGKKLAENGASVNYSFPGIKVHSKILYIERKIKEKIRAYAYIGTGNFNENTAKIYSDFGLMTYNKKITKELSQIFLLLQRRIIIPKTNVLLISPFNTRSSFRSMIENEIENAEKGIPAYITFKMNSLQDPKMINLLYKASNAGVNVRLIVRGICCLVPGIPGQSENIYATSIVDRYLEHSRVYIFANGGDEKMYMGSADLMTRNLDHRIEVTCPILDPDIYQKIKDSLHLQLEDNIKARVLDIKQSNKYVSKVKGKSSQILTYESIDQ